MHLGKHALLFDDVSCFLVFNRSRVKKMSEYKVIYRKVDRFELGTEGSRNADFKAFQKDVAVHLAQGWTCQGGVFATEIGTFQCFLQALIRDTTT